MFIITITNISIITSSTIINIMIIITDNIAPLEARAAAREPDPPRSGLEADGGPHDNYD